MTIRQQEIAALGRLINDIDSTGVADFNDWKWSKRFDNLEEATGFLLGHLKRTRELLKYGLTINKKLLEKLEDKPTHNTLKEYYYGKNKNKRKINT